MREDQISTASLAGFTILFAGADQRYAELADELQRLKARVIIFPKIELETTKPSPALDEAVANLYGYDWIIFKSVAAVECFLGRLEQLGHRVSDLDTVRVCAIGKATVQRLA